MTTYFFNNGLITPTLNLSGTWPPWSDKLTIRVIIGTSRCWPRWNTDDGMASSAQDFVHRVLTYSEITSSSTSLISPRNWLAKQDSVLVLQGLTGLSFWTRGNVSRSLRILTILLVKKSTNESDKLSVPDGQCWAGLEFRSFSTVLKIIPVFPEFSWILMNNNPV